MLLDGIWIGSVCFVRACVRACFEAILYSFPPLFFSALLSLLPSFGINVSVCLCIEIMITLCFTFLLHFFLRIYYPPSFLSDGFLSVRSFLCSFPTFCLYFLSSFTSGIHRKVNFFALALHFLFRLLSSFFAFLMDVQ